MRGATSWTDMDRLSMDKDVGRVQQNSRKLNRYIERIKRHMVCFSRSLPSELWVAMVLTKKLDKELIKRVLAV